MGKANRPRPKRLAEKLLSIRQHLEGGLSQNEMLIRLGLENDLERDRISKYERNTLEPPLNVLCAYANAANIYVEILINDDLNLPQNLPSRHKKFFPEE